MPAYGIQGVYTVAANCIRGESPNNPFSEGAWFLYYISLLRGWGHLVLK